MEGDIRCSAGQSSMIHEEANDTGDYYRHFDATMHAEFLYRCVEQTIDRDLPEEVAHLQAYDRFARGV